MAVAFDRNLFSAYYSSNSAAGGIAINAKVLGKELSKLKAEHHVPEHHVPKITLIEQQTQSCCWFEKASGTL